MEDALALLGAKVKDYLKYVLILVLMEDALALGQVIQLLTKQKRLNPCFNGRCTRTIYRKNIALRYSSLNPCFNGRCTRTAKLG